MRSFVYFLFFTFAGSAISAQPLTHTLLPSPVSVEAEAGIFTLDQLAPKGPARAFSPFRDWLADHKVALMAGPATGAEKSLRYIDRPDLAPEAYELRITPKLIELSAGSESGFLYAEQTLIQLAEQNSGHFIPCLKIRDNPRFSWRGMHLDESRHFMGKAFVKKYIDWLFRLKMNVFHWHLTDAQGWRIEIKKYPKLCSVGAWRPDRSGLLNSEADTAKVGEPMTYGGFYTQADIREIVQYATQRNITIIPEIEMPGHTTAALVAYPEYSCSGGPFPMPGGAKNCVYPNFCVGNEATYTFLQDILTEVMQLFPSPYIHIGGDEVEREQWKKCARCQARKNELGLADEAQLQVYFTKRIEDFLVSKGRKLMGWDEIMEGGNLSRSAGVMAWRGEDLSRRATQAGHPTVVAYNYYFDLYQGNPEFEPVSYGYLPLEQVYRYEPVPGDFTQEQQDNLLGVEGCLWTENVYDTRKAEYMLFPRLLALAEVAWSPRLSRNWDFFQRRLPILLPWLNSYDTQYATSIYDPSILISSDTITNSILCRFEQQIPYGTIRYTLDGSRPTEKSNPFKKAMLLEKPCEVQAQAFLPNGKTSKILKLSFQPSLAGGKPLYLKAQPQKQYNGENPLALTDGLKGSEAFHDGRWLGFYGDDFDATIRLDTLPHSLQSLQLRWLSAEGSWIYLPEEMWVETSPDGKTWTRAATLSGAQIDALAKGSIKPVDIDLKGVKAAQLRVFAKNKGQHPVYPDGKCWLFIDELSVQEGK